MQSIATVSLMFALAACGPETVSFGVGVASRTYVDKTRPTPANGFAPALAQRTLVTEIWYPAPLGSTAPEQINAPLADGGPFPLVVFVHGSALDRQQSTYLTQGLAAAGYVVVAADFPLTAGSTAGGPSDLHVEDETGDVRFVVDQLATDPLHGAIDPSAGYSVIGHSTGGAVALLAAYGARHDDRVRSVVAISADSCFFADSFFQTRSVPLLVLTGSRDLLVPPSDNSYRAYQRARGPKTYASLAGGSHMFFTDIELPDDILGVPPTTATSDLAVTLRQYGDGSACSPIPAASTDPLMGFADQHVHTVEIVRAYLAHTDVPSDASITIEHDP